MSESPIEIVGPESAKAIQEASKATRSAIEAASGVGSFFNRVLGNPIADAVGITVADPLRVVRVIALDWYKRRVDEILLARDAKIVGAPPRLAIEMLDAAQDETSEELRELWARLIANATDDNRRGYVRLEFVGILKQLNPSDARTLAAAEEASSRSSAERRSPSIAHMLGISSEDAAVSLLHLTKLGCVDHNGFDGSYSISITGRALLKACSS